MLLSFTDNVDLEMRLSMVEYFSGKGNVSRMFRDSGHGVGTFELEDSYSMDINMSAGFAFLAVIEFGNQSTQAS